MYLRVLGSLYSAPGLAPVHDGVRSTMTPLTIPSIEEAHIYGLTTWERMHGLKLPIRVHGTRVCRVDDLDHSTASDLVCSPIPTVEDGDEFATSRTQSRSEEGERERGRAVARGAVFSYSRVITYRVRLSNDRVSGT